MSVAGGCLIREADPGFDDDAVAALMVDYLTWAIERLASEYGVDEPPTSVASSGRTVELPSAIRETAHCRVRRTPRGCRRDPNAEVWDCGSETHVCRARLARSTCGVSNPGSAARRSVWDGRAHSTSRHLSVHDRGASALPLTRLRGAFAIRRQW